MARHCSTITCRWSRLPTSLLRIKPITLCAPKGPDKQSPESHILLNHCSHISLNRERGSEEEKGIALRRPGPRCLSAAWRRRSSFVWIALDTSLGEWKSWTCLCFEELLDLGSLIRVKHCRISRVFKHSLRLWYPSLFIYKYLFKGLPLSEGDKCIIVITMQRLWSEDSTNQSLRRSPRRMLNPNSSQPRVAYN